MSDSTAPRPRMDDPTAEVESSASTTRLPGARSDAYTRMPTGPVDAVTTSGPDADGIGAAGWQPDAVPEPEGDESRLAPWALLAAVVALFASFFVGWGIPVAIVAIIASIMSLRRPIESRAISIWSLVLGIVATVFSAGWLVWAALELGLIG